MHSWIYKQGEEKGRVAALRTAIEKTLSARKLRLTATRREQLAAEARPDVLQTWFDRALTASRAADVFADAT